VRKEADIKVLQTEHAKEKEKMVAEMDSLKLESAMARKDLSALQIDREIVQKTKEELASDAKRRFEVDMESLKAKLLRKEADIKVLQTGYAEEKEKMAAEIDSLKFESARNRKDLNDASYHAAAVAATDEKLAHMASVFSERENNFSKEKESLTQEIGELKGMLADIEAKRIQWLSAEDARRSEDSEARKREEGARKQLEEMSKARSLFALLAQKYKY
jgi:chromosome segregation ATPase